MDGFLVVDKPGGMTSHDVVAFLRHMTKEKKVGHTGTLDPIATGVLVLCFGAATKALPFLAEERKTYRVEAEIGSATDTQDRTGRTIAISPECRVLMRDLQRFLQDSLGRSMQTPPMYSAVKVGGRKLYDLARAGLEAVRTERPVEIKEVRLEAPLDRECLSYSDRFVFTISCNRGFYVRTYCHDLGIRLGCGAHLTELRRTASGIFSIHQAVTWDKLDAIDLHAHLLSLNEALSHLPAVFLDDDMARRVGNGNQIKNIGTAEVFARAVNPAGCLVAILKNMGDSWQPVRVF